MDEEISQRISRAKEFMATAELVFSQGYLWDVHSRAYYAVFNLLGALLLMKNIKLPKTHSGFAAVLWSNREELGVITKEDLGLVQKLMEERMNSDYGFTPKPGKSDVEYVLKQTRKLFEKVLSHVNKA